MLPWVSERESRPPLDAAPFPSCRLPASPPPRWALNSSGPARPPRLRRRLRLRLLPRPLFLLLLPPPPGPLGGRQRGRSRGLGAGRGAGGAGPATARLAWHDAPALASARPPCSRAAGPPGATPPPRCVAAPAEDQPDLSRRAIRKRIVRNSESTPQPHSSNSSRAAAARHRRGQSRSRTRKLGLAHGGSGPSLTFLSLSFASCV